MQGKVDSLPVELKNAILRRDVNINSIFDLIDVLDEFIKENE